MEKTCKGCNENKSIDLFSKWKKKNKEGFYYNSYCLECNKIRAKNWDDLPNNKIKRKQYKRNKLEILPDNVRLYNSISKSAKRKNLEIDVEIKDIIIPEFCPIFNWIKLSFENRDTTPVVDRIDNSVGYIKTNIRIISSRANRLKSDSTQLERKLLAEYAL